jgi:midasin
LGSYEQSETGEFVWVDSLLVNAIRAGNWVLLKNANLCLASVLDRLNSLLEPNGTLLIAERGQVGDEEYVISPGAGFRLFLAYNPKYGEVSRALRNRCVELALPNRATKGDYSTLAEEFVPDETFESISDDGLGPWALFCRLKEAIPPTIIYNREVTITAS